MAKQNYTVSYTGNGDFMIIMPGVEISGLIEPIKQVLGAHEVIYVGNGANAKVIVTPEGSTNLEQLGSMITAICHRWWEANT